MQRTDRDAVLEAVTTELRRARAWLAHQEWEKAGLRLQCAQAVIDRALKSTEPLTIGEGGLAEALGRLISDVDADRNSDALEAERTGERSDLWVYEVALPFDMANSILAALRNQSPDRGEG